jgi:hypothetical protein
MFTVDEPTAEAIRRAFNESGELAAVVELRRHFPLIQDSEQARACVRTIAGWKPLPPKLPRARRLPRRDG